MPSKEFNYTLTDILGQVISMDVQNGLKNRGMTRADADERRKAVEELTGANSLPFLCTRSNRRMQNPTSRI